MLFFILQRGAELRKRKREERIQSTAQKIEEIKKRQREHEACKDRNESLKPFLIGVGLAVFIGGVFLYRYYWGS